MPVSFSVEGPDSEDLNSVFSRGEWGYEERVMLDVSFPLLAKVLGSEDDPLESITVPHLLAIAYAVGWSGKMLSVVNPTDFAGQLEAAIEARGGMQDIGPAADTNLMDKLLTPFFTWTFFRGIAQSHSMGLVGGIAQSHSFFDQYRQS